ncbi:MAG: potassium channel protein [Pseudomonadota bacterium]
MKKQVALYNRLIAVFIFLLIVLVTGITGYVAIEGWSVLDAFYMVVITLASVGFMEVHPLSPGGRIFTMLLILCGSGILIYAISVITAFVVEGELTDILRRRKMNREIEKLSDHFIVCGAGQTAKYVIDELYKTKRPFVVIEKDAARVQDLIEKDILCMEGDASHDAVLITAGIHRAKGLVTALHSDAENLFVVITARRLNPALRLISKAVEEESELKIKLAGADSVVLPNSIGGLRMVSEMIRPSVVTFLDVMLRVKDRTVRIEDIRVPAGSAFDGKTLAQTGLKDTEGISILAIADGKKEKYFFNPPKSTLLKAGDVLIIMGDVEKIMKVQQSVLA